MTEKVANLKLKILCLHGYNQDGNFFKSKLGGFRKCFKGIADHVFIDAPHVIPPEGLRGGSCPREGRSWWFSTNENTFNAIEQTNIAKGFDVSVELIKEVFNTQGPFDGILGFSQGAALTALICSLKEQGEFPYDFQFAVVIAGFRSHSLCHEHLYQNTSKVPSLHVIGESDKVINKELSEALLSVFESPEVIFHGGGHFLPTTKEIQSAYKRFLKNYLSRKNVKTN